MRCCTGTSKRIKVKGRRGEEEEGEEGEEGGAG